MIWPTLIPITTKAAGSSEQNAWKPNVCANSSNSLHKTLTDLQYINPRSVRGFILIIGPRLPYVLTVTEQYYSATYLCYCCA